MRTFIFYLFLFSIFQFANLYSVAQWKQTNGPNNCRFTSIVTDNINVYAGTNGGGVFRSSDLGVTWNPINSGLSYHNVRSLSIVGGNIYAGTVEGGIFISKNKGESWTPINTGLNITVVGIIVGNGSTLFIATDKGIYRSLNNGSSWNPVNKGLPNTQITALAINGSNLFAGIYGGGLFLSTDNGTNWKSINLPLTDNTLISLISFGPIILAGTYEGILRSADNGANWMNVEPNVFVNSFMVKDSTILAGSLLRDGGVFRSADNGITWQKVHLGSSSNNPSIHAMAVVQNNLLAGGAGLFRSIDEGINWNKISTGLAPGIMNSIVISPTGSIYASGDVSYKSNDSGATWSDEDSIMPIKYFDNIRFHPNGTMFACGESLLKSTDNGLTWQLCMYLAVNDIAFNSKGDIFVSTGNDFIYKSTDNGNSWQKTNSGLNTPYITAILIDQNDRIFAGTWDQGLYISKDNGNTWSQSNKGLSTSLIKTITINSDKHIFVGNNWDGLYRSTDNGLNWLNIMPFPDFIQVSDVVFGRKNEIFVAINGGLIVNLGVWYSSDNGNSWKLINEGLRLPFYSNVLKLAIDSNFIYSATYYGIWKRPLTDFKPTAIEWTSKKNEIYIYPNPATGIIKIESSAFNKDQQVSIYDSKGKLVLQQSLMQTANVIDISEFASGIYFVIISGQDTNLIKKIIKK